MKGIPCKEFAYQLSFELNSLVHVKVRKLELGPDRAAGRDASARAPPTAGRQELYVTAQLFCDEHAMHMGPQTTRSRESCKNGQRVAWGEWLSLPVRYSELALNAAVVFAVWSAAKGLEGYAVVRLFDHLGRLKRGRVKLALQKTLQLDGTDSDLAADSAANSPSSEKSRVWQLGERSNHNEMTRLAWLDQIASERVRDIVERPDPGDKLGPVLTVELPYFEFPVLFEERPYHSETIDAIAAIRSRPDHQAQLRSAARFAHGAGRMSSDRRDWPAPRSSSSGGGTKGGGSAPFPWESNLCVVHDPELLYTQGRGMEMRETLNPVEEKYRKLNPMTMRGVVDYSLKPNKDERERIAVVIHKQAGRLNSKNQDLLWKFAYSLTSDKKALVKFVMSVEWENVAEARQAEELLEMWASIDMADALRLLGDEKEFRHPAVRAHAIRILDQASDSELQLYLLQLVQALHYDNAVDVAGANGGTTQGSEDGPGRPASARGRDGGEPDTWAPGQLAKFLIRRATASPSLISYFMWYLRTEVEHKESGLMFGRVHQELIKTLRETETGRALDEQLARQTVFIKKVVSLGKEGSGRANARQNCIQRLLNKPGGVYTELCQLPVPVMHPLCPTRRITGVDPNALRVFSSNAQPIKIDLLLEPESDGSAAGGNAAGSQNPGRVDADGMASRGSVTQDSSAMSDPPVERYPILLKIGDDLRLDQLVLQLLGVMDKMFKDVNLDLQLTLYPVLSFSNDEGVMEFVRNSTSLTQVNKEHGSIAAFFKKRAKQIVAEEQEQRKRRNQHAQQFSRQGSDSERHQGGGNGSSLPDDRGAIPDQQPGGRAQRPGHSASAAAHFRSGGEAKADKVRSTEEVYDEMTNRFIKSCAGYCMCTYILCVGDRHLDNILLRADGALFHIDFGYILGRDPRSWAVGPIRLTRDMIETMGGRGSPGFEKFISYCCQAYRVLRRNASLILNLLHLMKDSQIDNIFEDHESVLQIVRDRFDLDRTDEAAEIWLLDKLNKCEDTIITQFADTMHNAKVYFN